jgi:hypothetical protein
MTKDGEYIDFEEVVNRNKEMRRGKREATRLFINLKKGVECLENELKGDLTEIQLSALKTLFHVIHQNLFNFFVTFAYLAWLIKDFGTDATSLMNRLTIIRQKLKIEDLFKE